LNISKLPLGKEITPVDNLEAHKVTSALAQFTTTSKMIPKWTPEVVAEKASIGGLGPVGVGSPQTVADELERWVKEADVDGFNIGYVTQKSGTSSSNDRNSMSIRPIYRLINSGLISARSFVLLAVFFWIGMLTDFWRKRISGVPVV
jgi:hypothetical protein